jgi:hypothetical protein
MSEIDKTSFRSLTTSLYPDNTTGLISPADIRAQLDNIVDSTPFKVVSTSSPVVNDDGVGTGGNGNFEIGDIWIDTTTDGVWICADVSTGAAVWQKVELDGAEIKSLYEAETSAFTDAQFTKLSNIETAATADQTGSEIKSAYEAEASAFTDAQFTKLSNIETAATADQTGAQIKSAYEAEASAFTDAQFTKLSNIESLADVTNATNVTAAGALMDSELTSIADVKALDQSVVSGAAPVFASTNMTIDDTSLVVVDATNLQTFVEGADHALLKARGTGVTSSYVSTIGTTTFAQPEVFGEISSDEGYFDIHYTGATGVTVTTLSAPSTYVYLDNAGVLQQQVTTPTRQDWSRKIFLMRIAVNTVTEEILGFEYLNNPIGHYANSIRDVYTYLLAQGVPFKKNQVVTGRGAADLGFDVSAGTLLEFGGTGDINNANIKSFDAVANASYDLLDRTTIAATGQTDLVKFWDNADTITALGSTTLVGHRLYRFSNGAFAMQYGQGNYANMDLAKAGVLLEDYVLNPRLENATFFGWWFIESTATTTGGTVKTDFVEYTIGIQGGTSGGLAGCLLKGNNLSDLLDASVARTNLGLTAADIKVLYEGESSAFTDALFTKLSGIATSATGTSVTSWNTAGRPGSPAAGMFGYNTETAGFEGYTDAWGAVGGSGGGGLFKGNNGEVGSAPGDIFRVNAKTLTTNTTIDADENASATGPLTVGTGVTLTIASGGVLTIV